MGLKYLGREVATENAQGLSGDDFKVIWEQICIMCEIDRQSCGSVRHLGRNGDHEKVTWESYVGHLW